MSDPGLYFVEIDLACEQILFVFVLIEVIQSFDVFIDVGFQRDGQNVVKAIHIILRIVLFKVASFANVGQSIELIGYFCECFVTEKVVLFAIEVESHKIHLEQVSHILIL